MTTNTKTPAMYNTNANANAHTPGPWHACENGLSRNKFGQPQWTVGPTFHCLATVHRRDDDPAQMIADARLIAAAPELLLIAIKRHAWLADNEADLQASGDWGDDEQDELEALAAAIARARGE